MLTISDIRALAKNRFDCKYEKIAMIVVGLFFAWILIAAACQGFVTMDKTFTYAIPDSAVKIVDNSISVSYDFGKLSFNDYNIDRVADEGTKKGNMIFIVSMIIPLVIFAAVGCMYSYKKDRYVMVFQQRWLETGLIPDTDKIG
jgi:hypothetical protein